MSAKYTVTHEDLGWMVSVLEQIVYDPQGRVIHESRLGPKFTDEIRERLKNMKPNDTKEAE
jgi:hypothetical protein